MKILLNELYHNLKTVILNQIKGLISHKKNSMHCKDDYYQEML